jgi:hypothetical protein
MIGYAAYLWERDREILATTRMSPAARARAMGALYVYQPPVSDKTNLAAPPVPRIKKRILPGPRRNIPERAMQVIAAFCRAFRVKVDDVLSPSRKHKFVRPRHAAMHFLHRELKMSQPVVARIFKRGDHTTIFHAWHQVEQVHLIRDAEFSARYHRAVRAIRAMWAK